MSCKERYEEMFRYAQDELPDAEAAEMRAHLADCPVCRKRLVKLQAMESCVRDSLKTPVPAPDLAGRVMSALPRPVAPFRRTVRALGATTAVAAVFAAGVTVGVRLTPVPPKATAALSQAPPSATREAERQPEINPVLVANPDAAGTRESRRPGRIRQHRGIRGTERRHERPTIGTPPSGRTVNVASAVCDATHGIEPQGLNDTRLIDRPTVEEPRER